MTRCGIKSKEPSPFLEIFLCENLRLITLLETAQHWISSASFQSKNI